MQFCGVVLLACAVVVSSLEILSPASVAGHVESPYNNKFMSDNETVSDAGFNATMIEWPYGIECHNQQYESRFAGKLAVMSDANGYMLDQIRFMCTCVEAAGAVALLVRYNYPGPQSLLARVGFEATGSPCHIPMLCSRDIHTTAAIELLRQGENITVLVQANANPWVEVWDSIAFIVIFRVLIVVGNGVGVVVGMIGAVDHALALYRHKKLRTDKVLPWMVAGLSLEVIACAIRVVYMAGGAFYSNSTYSFQTHSFLITFTTPFEVVTILIAVIVFRQWIAFGRRERVGMRGQGGLVLVAVVLFALEIAAGQARASVKNALAFSAAEAIIYVPIVLVSSTLFMIGGSRFFLTLRGSFESHEKNRTLRKAVQWLIVSGSAEVVLIVSIGLVLSSAFYQPWGFFSSFVLHMSSITLISLAHVFAFLPQRKRKTMVQTGQTGNPLPAMVFVDDNRKNHSAL